MEIVLRESPKRVFGEHNATNASLVIKRHDHTWTRIAFDEIDSRLFRRIDQIDVRTVIERVDVVSCSRVILVSISTLHVVEYARIEEPLNDRMSLEFPR